MRTLGRVAVGSTLLGIVMLSGQGVASAQVGSALNVEVRLDPSAPTSGEIVSGLRSVDGEVRALEGVRRVDLYVVKSGVSTRDLDNQVPVDSFVSDVPLNKASFDLHWDSTATAPRLVDLIVVARTASRTGSVQVPGVRVEPVAAKASPAPAPAAPRAAAAPAAPKAAATAVARPAAAPPAAPRKAVVVAAAAASGTLAETAQAEVSEGQAQSFYAAFGQLPYAGDATPATLARAASIDKAAETSRGAWPFAAAGLVLMVSAAHAQRVVRVAPRSASVL